MDRQTKYWFDESIENLDTAQVLFSNKKYLECAFFCHLAMEKLLKAFIARRKKTPPPKTHNLLLLTQRSDLINELESDLLDFLANLTLYQIEGRYPGDREILYSHTPIEKFNEILKMTEEVINCLGQKLRSEK